NTSKNSSGVKVINMVGSKDVHCLQDDLTRRYFGFPKNKNDNYAINTGLEIGNQFLLINLDLTGIPEYTLDKIKINGNGTGDWNEIANQMIINPVQRDSNGEFVPYTGKITANIMSGTLIAPKAEVLTLGSYSGTVIANKLVKDCEIHKIVVRKHLDESATTTIKNSDGTIIPVPLFFEKYIDDCQAPCTETGKFLFTLRMYDEKERAWKVIDDDITNVAYSVAYSISEPEKIGMEYGGENTYYFMMTENDTNSEYLTDRSGILVKVKYYPGKNGEPVNEVCYYRITPEEVQSISSSFSKGYYNDAHRIRDKIGFNNKSRKPFDIELYKFLNGSALSDSNMKFNFMMTMIKVSDNGSREEIGKDRRFQGQNIASNQGPIIKYNVQPKPWGLEAGKSYYFLIREVSANSTNSKETTLDKALMAVRADYYVDSDDVGLTYYRIADEDAIDAINSDHLSVVDYCTDANIIEPAKAGFYNKTPTKVSVIKDWDQDSLDDIWDITVILRRRVVGTSTYEEVERFEIPASDCHMSGGHAVSTAYTFDDLEAFTDEGERYEYLADEYYNNGSELVPLRPIRRVVYSQNGSVVEEETRNADEVSIVNGYKNTENKTEVDSTGNTTITFTNTPYLKLKKIWTVNGVEVPAAETEEFGTVFVNLYKVNDGGSQEFFKGPIALSPGNNWTAEIAVPARAKYSIVECDSTGQNEYRTAPKITYYAYFKDEVTSTGTEWSSVYVQGTNTMLEVANERSGNVLPNSGGIGEFAMAITGAGVALMSVMGGAGLHMRNKRRRKREEEDD
ncbi:MAG: hypothetical protein IKZ97_04085, partial [Butyrivibrio sp.]|nr:hypothetical protein [Butyrivibrio sp.]